MALACAAIALALAAALRQSGALERLELALYDHLAAWRDRPAPPSDVRVVVETEEDLQRLGHPLPDGVLADLLERILADGPTAIVVDKYRDIPVAPGSERLGKVLEDPRVYWVRKMGDERSPPVRAPRALEGTPRALCNDIVADGDGRVRRYLLYLDDAKGPCYSVAFGAVNATLARSGAAPAFDAAGLLRFGEHAVAPLDPGHGPYVTTDLAGYQVALEFPGQVETLAMGPLLATGAPDGRFRDSVVFIGSSAASLRDFFLVPRVQGRDEMTGVELHAAAFASLAAQARGLGVRLAPAAVTWLLAVLTAILGAWSVLRIQRLAAGLAAVLVLAALVHAGVILAARSGWIAAHGPALLALALAVGAAVSLRVVREQREREEMMRFFGHQVSPEVAAAIWHDRAAFYANGRIPERDVDVTVLFLDIRNFTTMTEQLGARTIAWLNRGLGPMTDIVLAHGGVVTRFVGDQIMAVFGVPVPRKDTAQVRADACAAVASAVAIRDRLDRLREELAAEGLPAIRVRIGINSGRVTQGAVGSSARFEFSVFGDAVNTAARLESVATEDDGVSARILISESTHALCGDRFRSEPMGALTLKGKTHPVGIHRIHASLQPGSP